MKVDTIVSRKPQWLRVRYADNPNREAVEKILRSLKLNTVCTEANCPNYTECFSQKTATFLILGTACTRNCRFCNVRHDRPQPPNPQEPQNIARAIQELQLKYVVITSVTRDDLSDGGAEHFANVIKEIKNTQNETAIEVLIPDFKGDISALKKVTDAFPAVISHNMETVKSLYDDARPQAEYRRSLQLLKNIKDLSPDIKSKSGIIVGLGETKKQVHELFDNLIDAGCNFLTIGQYLSPSKHHLPVKEYITPAQFEEYGTTARQKGFEFVASAPLVRSSFRAGEALGM